MFGLGTKGWGTYSEVSEKTFRVEEQMWSYESNVMFKISLSKKLSRISVQTLMQKLKPSKLPVTSQKIGFEGLSLSIAITCCNISLCKSQLRIEK